MISPARRNQFLFILILVVVVGFVGVQMFYSLTPPRHADHDHAMPSLNAGGFLRIEAFEGGHRNLVGQPGHVLILHFFDPKIPNFSQQVQAARLATSLSNDPTVEMLFVARTGSRDGMETWAQTVGVSTRQLYLDEEGRTSDLLGVRRWPETLIYGPSGLLVHQARGTMDWSSPDLLAQIDRARTGVEEIP